MVWGGLCWARKEGAAPSPSPPSCAPAAPGGPSELASQPLLLSTDSGQGPGRPEQGPEPTVVRAARPGWGRRGQLAAWTLFPPTAGCRCDVGGALGQGCDRRTGACLCRPNTQGLTCSEWVPPRLARGGRGLAGWLPRWGPRGLPLTTPAAARPARDHYLPDLHDLRLELEEAATPGGRPVRFGFNPLEFESFSWRGYAQMTPVQVGGGLRPRPQEPPRRMERGGQGMAGEGPPDSPRPFPPPAQDRGKAERDLPRPLLAGLPLRQPWARQCERARLCARGGQGGRLRQL